MVILITGASHTGKTLLSQRLIERTHFMCLSIDHLKMGLIRSGKTPLTPYDDDKLTPYLWSIVREIVKTAIENRQNLIVEGCYIPFDWEKDFSPEYLSEIRYLCLVMSGDYIRKHFGDIKDNANAAELRLDDADCTEVFLLGENARFLDGCKNHGCRVYEITDSYDTDRIADFMLSDLA